LRLPKESLAQKNISFSTKLSFLEEETLIDDYINKEKQKLLLKQQRELTRQRALCTITSDKLRLFADMESKSLRLYYKDIELTKSSGLHISFLLNNTWYDSSSSEWQVKEKMIGLFWILPGSS
jgi:hypothetical protein